MWYDMDWCSTLNKSDIMDWSSTLNKCDISNPFEYN